MGLVPLTPQTSTANSYEYCIFTGVDKRVGSPWHLAPLLRSQLLNTQKQNVRKPQKAKGLSAKLSAKEISRTLNLKPKP